MDDRRICREEAGQDIAFLGEQGKDDTADAQTGTPIPVKGCALARVTSPAPTFWETKEAIDCIRALRDEHGELDDLAGYTVPEDASSRRRLIRTRTRLRRKSCVKNSWSGERVRWKEISGTGVEPEIMPGDRKVAVFLN